jgi:tetratricopeptide (TPR) repeat protein
MYDRKKIEAWTKDEYWGEYMERAGGLGVDVTTEQFKTLEKAYFAEIGRRIKHCKKLLAQCPDDSFLLYSLGSLCDRQNLDKDPRTLYKREARYYCLKALRVDPENLDAKILLRQIESWLELLGGKRGTSMPELKIIVKSLDK